MSADIDIKKIAKLAKLKLTPEQEEKFAKQLPEILDWVSKLNEVNTDDIPSSSYLTDARNVFREDEVIDCDPKTRQSIIDQFPVEKGGALQVPHVFN